MDDHVVVTMDRRNAALAALVSLGFVVLSVSLLVGGDLFVRVIGVGGFLFFGFGLVVAGASAIHRRVLLTIDSAGLRFHGIGRSAGHFVPWGAIAGVRIYRYAGVSMGRGVRMLGFLPAEPDSPVWRHGRLARVNTRLAGVPASISDRSVSMELEQLVEIMQRFKPDLKVE
jgi:hypothetical protein